VSSRQQQNTIWIVIGTIILVLVAGWLSRWKYDYYGPTRVRYSRFTGATEKRVQYGEDDVEWVPMEDFKHGRPVSP